MFQIRGSYCCDGDTDLLSNDMFHTHTKHDRQYTYNSNIMARSRYVYTSSTIPSLIPSHSTTALLWPFHVVGSMTTYLSTFVKTPIFQPDCHQIWNLKTRDYFLLFLIFNFYFLVLNFIHLSTEQSIPVWNVNIVGIPTCSQHLLTWFANRPDDGHVRTKTCSKKHRISRQILKKVLISNFTYNRQVGVDTHDGGNGWWAFFFLPICEHD